MQAYILITAQKGKEMDVYTELEDMKESIGVNLIFGEWDIIAKVNVENNEALGTFIVDKIRPMDGVNLTSALIVAK
jgi:DNA-binding Lrp family transcriptional regulator